jgi:HK97 family phage portal protein
MRGLGAWLSPGPQRFAAERGGAAPAGWRFIDWDTFTADAADSGPITRHRAMGLPGIGRGINLVADTIGGLTPNAIKYWDDTLRPIEILPRPPVLTDPDPLWHGRATWLAAGVRDLMCDGNCFADKTVEVDRLGYPTRLPLLPPHAVTWGPSRNPPPPGAAPAKAYTVSAPETGATLERAAGEMFHAAVGVDSGQRMGRGILQTHQDVLKLIAAVERATMVVMRDGKPVGVLSVDVDLPPDELAQVKGGFIAGVRRDGIAALVKASFSSVSWDANQLALVPAREFNLRLAADCTGVSPYLLGVPSESRIYSNTENEWDNFTKVTVQRYTAPLGDALTQCVPRGQVVRFNLDDLRRPDSKTRWANHKISFDIGAMTVDEIRQEERMGPLPGTDSTEVPA